MPYNISLWGLAYISRGAAALSRVRVKPRAPGYGPISSPSGRSQTAPPKHSPISHGGCCYFWDPPFSILTDFANPLANSLANSFLAMSATFKVE